MRRRHRILNIRLEVRFTEECFLYTYVCYDIHRRRTKYMRKKPKMQGYYVLNAYGAEA
jgi:hypothetical protein